MDRQGQIEWAADRASNTYQTYDRVLPLFRGLSRLGVLGTFVTFKLELARNVYHIAKYAKEGIQSNNPALKADGFKKMASLTAALGIASSLAAVSKKMVGVSDDEEKAFKRTVAPPWDRNEDMVFIGKDGPHWRYAPTSYLLPHAEFKKAVVSGWNAATDKSPDSMSKFLGGVMADYFGPGAAAGPLMESLMNQRIGGGDVTKKEGFEGAKDRARYLWHSQSPKMADPLIDIYDALTGRKGNYGKETSPSDPAMKLMALRVRSVDVSAQIPHTIAEFSARWRNASSVENIAEKKYVADADKQASEAKYTADKKSELKLLYKQAMKDYQTLGVTPLQIREAEIKARVPVGLRE